MSTSPEFTARDCISSILLAIRQMRRPSPDKILHLKLDPDPSEFEEYDYLDALATLLSFVSAQCSSASAAIEYYAHSSCLYIATSPGLSVPPALRALLLAWISLIQNLSSANGPSSSKIGVSSVSEGPVCHNAPEQNFIIEIYRACHSKFLAVASDDGQKLLDCIAQMTPRDVDLLGLAGRDGDTSLVPNLELLISMGKNASEPLSAEDLLRLHRAAGVVARFKYNLLDEHPILVDADRLSHAVDTIVEFATSSDHKARIDLPWDVVWIDAPSAPRGFLATTNKNELAGMLDNKLHDHIMSAKWPPFEPSGDGVHAVAEGPPGHFTGTGAVHCATALLHYVFSDRPPIEPYIGCSHPVCYPCLTLVRTYNRAFGVNIGVGCRCISLRRLDVAWSYPEAGLAVDRSLANSFMWDFEELLTQPRYTAFRPIVTDPSDLPEYFHRQIGPKADSSPR